MGRPEDRRPRPKYFKTAETGDKGQFLLGDPSYVSYDADIIKNLNLPFKVVIGGGEAALITAIDTAFKDKTPLLFYFYTPQWANAKYDLVEREAARRSRPRAPRRRPIRARTASTRATTRPTTCMKAISAKLETKNPGAFKFLKKMKWTDHDQNTVTKYKNEDDMTIDGRGPEVGRRQPDRLAGLAP